MTTLRTTILTVGIATLLIGAAGCATASRPSAPTATQTSATAATPTTTPKSTPTPTPTSVRPSSSPSGPASWVFGDASFGPVQLGATDVGTVLPAAGFSRQPSSGCPTFWEWQSADLSTPSGSGYRILVTSDDSGPGVRYISVAGQATDPGAFSSPVLTSTGIALGSTADDVRAAYPGLEKTIDTWEPPIGGYREYVAPTTDGHWLHFDTTGGASGAEDIVTTIVINDTKAATQDVCR
ncbi:hypothetical protein [Curtobacterium sp. MCBA15_005]|uniref:hypothetical protein n=1 Tax=Curtobacterium sp. MCBA15_005 TaxID=1898734 RepID=UPI0008DD51E5|nr:hypothetical protein [Curtobacterium sp. MCBA15_005]OII01934.1 hypothetical protein BIU89_03895 [Curtobacterium sp. MCBA15_005]